MSAYAMVRRGNADLRIVLWLAYLSIADCTGALLLRESMNVRLAFGMAVLTLAEYGHALPAVGAFNARALLGAAFFCAYAFWTSVPALHRTYAEIVAMTVVPSGHAYQVVDVRSDSMAPTITAGGIAVVDFSAYGKRVPRPGQIVAVEVRPHEVYLKRLVAVPGDRFEIDAGQVLVNGRAPVGWHSAWAPSYQLTVADDTIEVDGLPLDRSLADVPPPAAWPDPSRLPDNCYFVLGDNVNDSEDSHIFGCVPGSAIVGRVVRVL